MKQILLTLGIAVSMVIFGVGFEKTDIAILEPVQTVSLRTEGDVLVLSTDTGSSGSGYTVQTALNELKESAEGNVFLDTAEFVIVDRRSKDRIEELTQVVRPGCLVCVGNGEIELKDASQYLKTHEPGVTLNDCVTGTGQLETLTVKNGRLKLEDGTD